MADDAERTTRRATLRQIAGLSSGLALAGCLRLSATDGTETATPGNGTTPATPTAEAGTSPRETPSPSPQSTEQRDDSPTPEDETPIQGDETPTPVTETPSSEEAFEWLSNANNFTGDVVDRTGQETVRVTVGPRQASFSFDPAAVTVDSGTTVVWEWTGYGGGHSVVAVDGSFSSGEAVSEAGVTFEHAFSTPGIYRYYCRPHRGVDMKGIVDVV